MLPVNISNEAALQITGYRVTFLEAAITNTFTHRWMEADWCSPAGMRRDRDREGFKDRWEDDVNTFLMEMGSEQACTVEMLVHEWFSSSLRDQMIRYAASEFFLV